MSSKLFYLVCFLWTPAVSGYCPSCEQNNHFLNLMNAIQPSPPNSFSAANQQSPHQTFWQSHNTNFDQNYHPFSPQQSTFNIFGQQPSNSANNHNFQRIPIRFITTGYGCCQNTFGPCCQPAQSTHLNSFAPSSQFGSSFLPAIVTNAEDFSQPFPILNLPSFTDVPQPEITNNIAFGKSASGDRTVASATFSVHPDNNNQVHISGHSSQPEIPQLPNPYQPRFSFSF